MRTSHTSRRGGRRPARRPSVSTTPPLAGPIDAGDRLASLERWLGDHKRIVLLTLVLLSALFRGVYFAELNAGPCIRLHQWEQTDMSYFHTWGKAIAEGDVLSESVGVSMHTWH